MLLNERLGLSRAEMPQLEAEQIAPFLAWLRTEHGATHTKETVDAKGLGKTQKSINGPKVRGMVQAYKLGQFPALASGRVIVSSDGFVLDGHHRWAALKQMDMPIHVWRSSMPIDQLVQAALLFLASRAS